MARSSFGLGDDKKRIFERLFQLTEYCNLTQTEAWHIPLRHAEWLIMRKQKELKDRAEAQKRQKGNPATTPAPTRPKARQ